MNQDPEVSVWMLTDKHTPKTHTPAVGQNVANKEQLATAFPIWAVIVLLLCNHVSKPVFLVCHDKKASWSEG